MTTTAGPQPDLAAHSAAMRLDPAVLVKELRDLLGARLVAYLGGVRETRAVRLWADGTREVGSDLVVQRLRTAYQAAHVVAERDSPGVVQAWFQGLNPQLGDASPATLLRTGDLAVVGPQVMSAARAFAATG